MLSKQYLTVLFINPSSLSPKSTNLDYDLLGWEWDSDNHTSL